MTDKTQKSATDQEVVDGYLAGDEGPDQQVDGYLDGSSVPDSSEEPIAGSLGPAEQAPKLAGHLEGQTNAKAADHLQGAEVAPNFEGYLDAPTRDGVPIQGYLDTPESAKPNEGYLDKAPSEGYLDKAPSEGYLDKAPSEGYLDKAPNEGYLDKAPNEGYLDKAPKKGYLDKAASHDPGQNEQAGGTGRSSEPYANAGYANRLKSSTGEAEAENASDQDPGNTSYDSASGTFQSYGATLGHVGTYVDETENQLDDFDEALPENLSQEAAEAIIDSIMNRKSLSEPSKQKAAKLPKPIIPARQSAAKLWLMLFAAVLGGAVFLLAVVPKIFDSKTDNSADHGEKIVKKTKTEAEIIEENFRGAVSVSEQLALGLEPAAAENQKEKSADDKESRSGTKTSSETGLKGPK